MTNTQITNKQEVDFVLAANTDQDVPIDTSPAPVYSFESGPTDPVTVTPNVTGFAGTLTSGTSPGDTLIACSFFVGGVPQTAEITVTVTADGRVGNAVFTFGVPTDKTVPTPPAPTAK